MNRRNAAGRQIASPLFMASERGHETIVQLLLERGADVTERRRKSSSSPLYIASERGYETIVQMLLEKGADAEDEGPAGTAVHRAWENGHEKVVRLLVEHGAQHPDNYAAVLMDAVTALEETS